MSLASVLLPLSCAWHVSEKGRSLGWHLSSFLFLMRARHKREATGLKRGSSMMGEGDGGRGVGGWGGGNRQQCSVLFHRTCETSKEEWREQSGLGVGVEAQGGVRRGGEGMQSDEGRLGFWRGTKGNSTADITGEDAQMKSMHQPFFQKQTVTIGPPMPNSAKLS